MKKIFYILLSVLLLISIAQAGPLIDCDSYTTSHVYTLPAIIPSTNCAESNNTGTGIDGTMIVQQIRNSPIRPSINQIAIYTTGNMYIRSRDESLVWTTWIKQ